MLTQKKGILYLIPTPLSQSVIEKSVTPELRKVVASLKYFLAENIRTARRFISSLEAGITIENLQIELLDKNTDYATAAVLCAPLLRGENIGVMSEAGCPGIADPGNMAVTFAHKNNVQVMPLVGPSSIFMALMASGFNGQSFAFHGYLPIKNPERTDVILSLEKTSIKNRQTQIFMETPYRNDQLLNDLLEICQPSTMLCIARDITGENELILSKSVKDWKKSTISLHKMPVIFLMQGV